MTNERPFSRIHGSPRFSFENACKAVEDATKVKELEGLLIAYMARVIDAEGVSFVDDCTSSKPPPITELQLQQLREIEEKNPKCYLRHLNLRYT